MVTTSELTESILEFCRERATTSFSRNADAQVHEDKCWAAITSQFGAGKAVKAAIDGNYLGIRRAMFGG